MLTELGIREIDLSTTDHGPIRDVNEYNQQLIVLLRMIQDLNVIDTLTINFDHQQTQTEHGTRIASRYVPRPDVYNAVFDFLRVNTSVTTLVLMRLPFGYLNDALFNRLLEVLRANSTIRSLELRDCSCVPYPERVPRLIQTLIEMPSVTSVSIVNIHPVWSYSRPSYHLRFLLGDIKQKFVELGSTDRLSPLRQFTVSYTSYDNIRPMIQSTTTLESLTLINVSYPPLWHEQLVEDIRNHPSIRQVHLIYNEIEYHNDNSHLDRPRISDLINESVLNQMKQALPMVDITLEIQ